MKTNQTLCAVPVCDREVFANGYCEAHNKEWKRHGSVQNRVVRGSRIAVACYRVNARFDEPTSEEILAGAKEKDLSPYALIQDIVKRWGKNRKRRRARTADRSTAA